MQVLQGLANDAAHMLDGKGAYEWWYVDALSADGEWGVVGILFKGMPMSPTYLRDPSLMRAGCAVSVYYRGVRIAFSFTEQDLDTAVFDTDTVNVAMGQCGVSIDATGRFTFGASVPCDNDGRAIDVRIIGTAQQKDAIPGMLVGMHAWVLAQPRMPASIHVRICEAGNTVVEHRFDALAYHDHNMGRRAMHNDFADWYWGRAHFEGKTVVYLSTPRSADAVSIVADVGYDGSISMWENIRMRYSAIQPTSLGLVCGRNIIISGESALHGHTEIVCRNSTACEDSPFYQRYISEWTLNNQERALGMSEYMNVSRLASRWIRPFLSLPLINLSTNER